MTDESGTTKPTADATGKSWLPFLWGIFAGIFGYLAFRPWLAGGTINYAALVAALIGVLTALVYMRKPGGPRA